jgi:hypothetical protein
MANDNEFSFGNLGKDYDDRKVNNDYLDLLSETEVNEEDVRQNTSRDIYSDSSLNPNKKRIIENIYADDVDEEPEDVFTLNNEPQEYEDIYSNNDIYFSKKTPVKQAVKEEYIDIPITQKTRQNTVNTVKTSRMDLDEDEISDYEVKRGKRVPQKKKKKKSPKFLVFVAVLLAVVIGATSVVISSVNGIVNNFTKGEKIEHIPADKTYIQYDNDAKPHVEVYQSKLDIPEWLTKVFFLNWLNNKATNYYILVVPEGTITTSGQYEIDMN